MPRLRPEDRRLLLETKTNEDDTHCPTCGYFSERRIVNLKGKLFMETTHRLLMTHDGIVVCSPWNAEAMAKPEGCNCYGCHGTHEERIEKLKKKFPSI